MKKKISILVVCAMLLCSLSKVYAIDYSEDEDYWYSVCNGRITEDLIASCQGFNAYLTQKANNVESSMDSLDEQIAAIQGDIDRLFEVLQGIQSQIADKDSEIQTLQNQINELESNISILEEEIVVKQQDIEQRDAQIKETMVETQTFKRTFGFIDFLMGATDFVDLIRRFSIMNQITASEQEQIDLLSADIAQLELDQSQLEVQKEGVEAQKSVLDSERSELAALESYQNQLIAEQHEKEADLMDEYSRLESTVNSIRNSMPSFSVGDGDISDTTGFGMVVSGYRSAGTWYYPASFGGARHSGMDIAGSRGTPVYASFNGIVAIAQNITSVEGTKNPATGNNVMIIGTVNGTTYAIHMLHLQYNSITVSPGQVVTQGQVVAARGSTGNSTGPHVHIDLYNLGSMTVEEAYNYVRNTGNYTFGMSYHAYGWECSNKAPVCRERPEDYIPY